MTVCSQIHSRIGYRCRRGSVALYSEVRHIAGVGTIRIIQAVLFGVRVEMRTGGCECRRLTLGYLMNMNCVLAGGKVRDIRLYLPPLAAWRQLRRAHAFARSVL